MASHFHLENKDYISKRKTAGERGREILQSKNEK